MFPRFLSIVLLKEAILALNFQDELVKTQCIENAHTKMLRTDASSLLQRARSVQQEELLLE